MCDVILILFYFYLPSVNTESAGGATLTHMRKLNWSAKLFDAGT